MSQDVLYLDLGASLTKGFFLGESDQVVPLLMEPEVAGPLDVNRLRAVRSYNASSQGEHCAWLERDGSLWAVGKLATNLRGGSYLEERKEVRAVEKILAAIGVMKERLYGDAPVTLRLRLGLLLPFSEFETRVSLWLTLRSIKEFKFRGQLIKLEFVSDVFFRPEGFGLCLARLRAFGQQHQHKVSRLRLVSIMLGQRNASQLVIDESTFQGGKSNSRGPGFEQAELAAMQSGTYQQSDLTKLQDALRGGDTKLVLAGDAQLSDVSMSVCVGHVAYWSQLAAWMNATLTPQLNGRTYVMVSGGVTCATSPERSMLQRLQDYFSALGLEPDHYHLGLDADPLWESKPLAQLLEPYALDREELQALVARTTDVYESFLDYVVATRAPAEATAAVS